MLLTPAAVTAQPGYPISPVPFTAVKVAIATFFFNYSFSDSLETLWH
jgi:hypothetical protein